MIGCGIGAYAAAWNGWYPVALVNYQVISAAALEQNVNIAYTYYKNVLTLSGGDPSSLNTPQSSQELERATLDELISRALVTHELQQRMSAADLQTVVNRTITNLTTSTTTTLTDGVEKLYGMSLDAFKAEVLTPEAYTEVLQGRMNFTSQDFTSWLADARKNASVIILYPGLSWDGTKVAAH